MRGLFSLFAAAVCALAACGGDDASDGAYREEANALCAEAIREAESVTPPRSARGLERFLRESLEISGDYDERLDALEPPAELAKEHRSSVRLNRRAERLTEGVLDDLEAGDAPRDVLPGYLQELLEITEQSNQLSRSMGLPECVVPIAGPGSEPAAPS